MILSTSWIHAVQTQMYTPLVKHGRNKVPTIKVGDKLKNSAIVVAVKEYKNDHFVVLAVRTGHSTKTGTYVTWKCTNHEDTVYGNYYSNIVDAANDFTNRL